MKTIALKENSNRHHISRPFFAKGGNSGLFFARKNLNEPFFQRRSENSPVPKKDCCGDSKSTGLDNGDVAGVICCEKKKHACLWVSGGATGVTDPKAISIVDKCGIAHEKAHFDDVDCPAGAAANRPSFKAGKVAADEEKKSYKVEQKCLESEIKNCGKSATCKADVEQELAHVKANT